MTAVNFDHGRCAGIACVSLLLTLLFGITLLAVASAQLNAKSRTIWSNDQVLFNFSGSECRRGRARLERYPSLNTLPLIEFTDTEPEVIEIRTSRDYVFSEWYYEPGTSYGASFLLKHNDTLTFSWRAIPGPRDLNIRSETPGGYLTISGADVGVVATVPFYFNLNKTFTLQVSQHPFPRRYSESASYMVEFRESLAQVHFRAYATLEHVSHRFKVREPLFKCAAGTQLCEFPFKDVECPTKSLHAVVTREEDHGLPYEISMPTFADIFALAGALLAGFVWIVFSLTLYFVILCGPVYAIYSAIKCCIQLRRRRRKLVFVDTMPKSNS